MNVFEDASEPNSVERDEGLGKDSSSVGVARKDAGLARRHGEMNGNET
jgi:hypothetical protein